MMVDWLTSYVAYDFIKRLTLYIMMSIVVIYNLMV